MDDIAGLHEYAMLTAEPPEYSAADEVRLVALPYDSQHPLVREFYRNFGFDIAAKDETVKVDLGWFRRMITRAMRMSKAC